MSKRKHPEPTESLQSTKVSKWPGRQGIHLTSQAKYIVINVRKFKKDWGVLDRTATATGISRSTISKTLTTGGHFLTSIKKHHEYELTETYLTETLHVEHSQSFTDKTWVNAHHTQENYG